MSSLCPKTLKIDKFHVFCINVTQNAKAFQLWA